MGKREIIGGEGIPSHPQPFPTAVKMGNMIFSSAVGGQDPATGKAPEDKTAQINQAFENVRRIMEKGGGDLGDIAKMVVYLKDRGDRDLVNAAWIAAFPDEDDRPVRHTVELPMPGHRMIQLEFVAVL